MTIDTDRIPPRTSGSTIKALAALTERGALSHAGLAAAVGTTAGWATQLVDSMAAAGLARRRPAEGDRRVVWVEITESGREMIEGMRAVEIP